MYKLLGDYNEAIDDFTQCLKYLKNKVENDMFINVLLNRAYAFGKINKYKDAITDYSRILKHYPNHIHSLFNRAICYQKDLNYIQVIYLKLIRN